MKSLDVKIGEPKASSDKSLLELYNISVLARNIGVAFPLTLTRDFRLPRSGSHDDSAVRAFLFSIKTIEFGTQLGENGQASMAGFSFQFVSRYGVASLRRFVALYLSSRFTGSDKATRLTLPGRTTRRETDLSILI